MKQLTKILSLIALFLLTGCIYLEDVKQHGPLTSKNGQDEYRLEIISEKFAIKWLKKKGTTADELIGKTKEDIKEILGKPKDSNKYLESNFESWRYIIPHYSSLLGFDSLFVGFQENTVIYVDLSGCTRGWPPREKKNTTGVDTESEK